jgi:hypothetical protein
LRLEQEAKSVLLHHCNNLAALLEQSLSVFYSTDLEQEREKAFKEIKSYSADLVLLESFYAVNPGKTKLSQLQKLCILLGHENYQKEGNEQLALLTKIYQSLAQIPPTYTDKYTF